MVEQTKPVDKKQPHEQVDVEVSQSIAGTNMPDNPEHFEVSKFDFS
jgi:hypothetical protein